MRTSGSGFQLGVSEASLLVVKEGGLMLPLCPGGWHGLELINAFSEPGVDHLLEAINKAYIAKSRDGPMDFKLLNQFLYQAITLTQGGELPLGSGLVVWVHKHLIEL